MATRAVRALLLLVGATSLLPAQSADTSYVIRKVRVFDGETVAEQQTVVAIWKKVCRGPADPGRQGTISFARNGPLAAIRAISDDQR